MRVAALILAHHNPASLKRLVFQCLDCNADVYIHLDAKCLKSDFVIDSSIETPYKVLFIENRINCKWGSISLVKATYSLFKQAYENNYDYYFLLSGEDVIVSNNLIQDLSDLNGDSMFAYWQLPYDKWWGGGMFRIDKFHFFDNRTKRSWNFKLDKYFGFILRRFSTKYLMSKHLHKMLFYGGQQWMAISREAMDFLLFFIDSNPKIWDVFKRSFAPDEMFYHTILLNNEKINVINRPTHYVRFIGAAESPEYINNREIEELRKNREYLFARKYA